MNAYDETREVSPWRTMGVPLVVTVAALAFWIEYYGSVGWWPAVLFVLWAVQYARYATARRGETD